MKTKDLMSALAQVPSESEVGIIVKVNGEECALEIDSLKLFPAGSNSYWTIQCKNEVKCRIELEVNAPLGRVELLKRAAEDHNLSD